MSDKTPRLNINIFKGTDHVIRQAFNENWDIIDNNAETPADAQDKANTAEQNAKNYTDTHEGKATPHSGHEKKAEKGTANGYCPLDSGGKVPEEHIPVTEGTMEIHGNEMHDPNFATRTGDYTGLRARATTKLDVGLGSVLNKEQLGVNEKAADSSLLDGNTLSQVRSGVTKFHVGLGNVDNVKQATKEEFEAHLSDYESKFPNNAGAHNSIYRGKYLGDTYTTAQQNAISNGTFEDLYIGDYWTIGGINYRIAAFNYYYNAGHILLTDNHVTLVPDTSFYDHVMNDTNTTDGGYVGSKMYTEGLDSAKATIDSAFGASNVVEHSKYLCNKVSDGEASGGGFYDSKVELMTEVMVYGCIINGASQPARTNEQVGFEKIQLPIFSLRPDFANIVESLKSYWLRDVVSAARFAATAFGIAGSYDAGSNYGVRPVFSIY